MLGGFGARSYKVGPCVARAQAPGMADFVDPLTVFAERVILGVDRYQQLIRRETNVACVIKCTVDILMAIDEIMESDAFNTASERTLWQINSLRRRFRYFRAFHYNQVGDAVARGIFDRVMTEYFERELPRKAMFQCSLVTRLLACTSLTERQAYDFVYFYTSNKNAVLAVARCHMLAYLGETDPALLLPGGFTCQAVVLAGVLRDLSEACEAEHTLSRAYVHMIPACDDAAKLSELTVIIGNQVVLHGPDRETALAGTPADTHTFLVQLHRRQLRIDVSNRHAGVALSYSPAKMLQASFQDHNIICSLLECVLCRVLDLLTVHAVVNANFEEMGLQANYMLHFPRDFLTHMVMLSGPFSAQNQAILAEAFPPPARVLLGG